MNYLKKNQAPPSDTTAPIDCDNTLTLDSNKHRWPALRAAKSLEHSVIRTTNSSIPLPERAQGIKYPVDALGPVLGETAERIAWHVQTPVGLAGQSVLAATALACQGHTDISRGAIGAGPLSLYCISVADSGDRKTSVDRLALNSIREWERERRESLQEHMANHIAAIEIWGIQRSAVINALKPNKNTELTPDQQTRLNEELRQLELCKPKPPKRANITLEEPTAEGIFRHLQESEPSAGLFNDEGIGFFDGHGMSAEARGRMLAYLSNLWDGTTISRSRGEYGQSSVLAGRRLSAHLMLQPVVASRVFRDPLLQGQGFLPRFLICQESSLAGTRLLAGRDLNRGPQNDPEILRYWEVLGDMLRQPLAINEQTGELKLHTMYLEDSALNAWCNLHDGFERQQAPGGVLAADRPHASKASENAVRIAGLLALAEGYTSPLVEHIERAGRLMNYYLQSTSLRTNEALQDKEELAARDLLEWIVDHGGELHACDFNRLPRVFRSAKRARQLLFLLVDLGQLTVLARNQYSQPRAWCVSGEL